MTLKITVAMPVRSVIPHPPPEVIKPASCSASPVTSAMTALRCGMLVNSFSSSP